MAKPQSSKTVNIAPGSNVLSIFRYLNYKAWYALAEFVDNAIQSATQRRSLLAITSRNGSAKVSVAITIDDERSEIKILDNAAGIALQDIGRAFKTATPPPDRDGLSEFGVGMKSAAFWFAPKWNVHTKALSEDVSRTINFDVAEIIKDSLDFLPIFELPAGYSEHYTCVTLQNVYKLPKGRTIGKIRTHLASIYRTFLREGFLELSLDGKPITFGNPSVLRTESAWNPKGPQVDWKKNIDFAFADGCHCKGFAALRSRGSTSEAGFALLRRGRLIEGSADDAYRPVGIFGGGNSYRSQRLFGELEIDGVDVTHTKDGFRWGETEADFLQGLARALSSGDVNLLRQADEYRVRKSTSTIDLGPQFQEAVETYQDYQPLIDQDQPLTSAVNHERLTEDGSNLTGDVSFMYQFGDQTDRAEVVLSNSLPHNDLYLVRSEAKQIEQIIVNTRHPLFSELDKPGRALKALIDLLIAVGLAEVIARTAASESSTAIRRHTNQLLRRIQL